MLRGWKKTTETASVNTDVRDRSYAPAGKTRVTYTVGGESGQDTLRKAASVRGRAGQQNLSAGPDRHVSDRLLNQRAELVQFAQIIGPVQNSNVQFAGNANGPVE